MFKQATKEKLKARIAIDGVAGGGKSFTALRWAMAMAGPQGRVAVIDTEHRSASKYIGEAPDGVPFKFDTCELSYFGPANYTNVIKEAGKLGYDVLVIDSLSHAWEGVGGALDQVDKKAAAERGNSFSAWRDVTPQHREMVEAMLACPCHLIVTMRSKMAYELEQYDDNGKTKTRVNKLGLKPIQREGLEYEFDVVADIDLQHVLTISKTRCRALDGKKASQPDGHFIMPFLDWLNTGVEPAPPEVPPAFVPEVATASHPSGGVKLSGQLPPPDPHSQSKNEPCGDDIADAIKRYAAVLDLPTKKVREFSTRCGVQRLAEIPYREAEELLAKLKSRAMEKECPF